MRRLIAVVALLVTTWPHIAVMRCVGPAPSPVSATSSMVSSEHEHGGAECPAVMVCTAAMIESTAPPTVVEPEAPTLRGYALRSAAPITAVLIDEPPPPRHSA